MNASLSRRDFLKLGLLALGGLAFQPYTPFLPALTEFDEGTLVRVATDSVSVYQKPDDESRIVGNWPRDTVLHVYETIRAEKPAYNPVWYRVWGGYMHRAHLQRVSVRYNPVKTRWEEDERYPAEVTVPFTQAMWFNERSGWRPNYRLYYQSVHWVDGIITGPDGEPWYRIMDELFDLHYYAPAIHFRLFSPQEMTPLSPDLPFNAKRIEVNLATQILRAYENERIVLETTISSGNPWLAGPGQEPTATPRGEFNIQSKMPSKHMGNGSLAAGPDDYELPGVPWTMFFTERGHAFHGTYWHDNYGVPMSHGCINMRPAEALWLFRWAAPPAALDDIHPLTLDKKGYGTRVIIF